ncbi:transcriptional regulator [Saccharomonospora sp. CUA-673]|uniref:ROK family transcriptional regulator n=1 Tax=Saccharomonospora sp. CUA-673 TaxID=1904969 RepID=UPI00095FFA84|nr:ROK family transcriptional regulator [Saccharomonospora sp. CUA-673]OLT48029.1 transcriptional regulator [Saccharomonospora sp. CUA-673]
MTNQSANPPSATSPGHVLAVLRAHGPMTRQELQERIGLSRVTLVERLDALRRQGFVRASGHRDSSGGRRAELLEVDDETSAALTVDLGQSHAALAVTDLRGSVAARETHRLPVRHRPDDVVPMLLDAGRELLSRTGRTGALRAMALSLPGQIDHERGVTVAPPTMPDWNGRTLRDPFEDAFGVPVLLENDANALAFGDYCAMGRPDSTVLGVKVGTGIGAGVVVSGRIHRGESGTAGEMGHMRIEGSDRRCGCGRRGCVAANASGSALVRDLRAVGVRSMDDVVRRVADGRGDAVRAAAEAGHLVGTVLATVVTIINPRFVRVGGAVGILPPFLEAVRKAVEEYAHASALRGLEVSGSELGEDGAFVGLAGLVADATLSPAAVDATLAP